MNDIKIALTRFYRKEGKSYPAGMTLDIKPEDFNPAFMEKIVEAPVVEKVVTVQETEESKPVQNVVRRKTWKLPEEP